MLLAAKAQSILFTLQVGLIRQPTRIIRQVDHLTSQGLCLLKPWLHAPIIIFLVRGVVQGNQTRRTTRTSDGVSDFLVRGSDGRLLADRQKTSCEEIGKNEHAHSVRFPRSDEVLNLERLVDVGQHIGRGNRCV